ncbi:MAG: M48 family metallopeptidase [Planctomycetota bacterium]|jgi:Zn-dependent protease with chaperone function
MDFFTSQDRARRNTGLLVALYAAAVVAVILAVYMVIWFLIIYAQGEGERLPLWQPELMAYICGGTLIVVAAGTAFKLIELSAGGEVVAKALGGRRLEPGARDPIERKVLNVVEEMAIASGMAVPDVYLLDNEQRINAFAAGKEVDEAVIGVTRGCAEQLSRDELQGVIAHEFSHILHGDMKLNLRLVGVLNGILVIGLIGSLIMRNAFFVGSSRSRDDGRVRLAIIVLGLALVIVGSMGTLFGRLIQAAVSRQREYLADASAVAFTRDPSGIAGALKRIGATQHGARIQNAHVAEYRHMYFGAGMKEMFGALATHPPLETRIRRIQPSWNGAFPAPRPVAAEPEPKAAKKAQPQATDMIGAAILAGAISQVGRPSRDHLEYSRTLLQGIPTLLKDAVHTVKGAHAVVLATLIDEDRDSRVAQMKFLEGRSAALRDDVVNYAPMVAKAGPAARLTLIDLAMPTLRHMNQAEYEELRDDSAFLSQTDRIIDPFEWVLGRILKHYLLPKFENKQKPRVAIYDVSGVRTEMSQLLTQLARTGQAGDVAQTEAFEAGAKALGDVRVAILPAEACTLPALDTAVDKIATLAASEKKKVLEACSATIAADGQVTIHEGELLRGIADVLDCPMPPLLPGMAV